MSAFEIIFPAVMVIGLSLTFFLLGRKVGRAEGYNKGRKASREEQR